VILLYQQPTERSSQPQRGDIIVTLYHTTPPQPQRGDIIVTPYHTTPPQPQRGDIIVTPYHTTPPQPQRGDIITKYQSWNQFASQGQHFLNTNAPHRYNS